MKTFKGKKVETPIQELLYNLNKAMDKATSSVEFAAYAEAVLMVGEYRKKAKIEL